MVRKRFTNREIMAELKRSGVPKGKRDLIMCRMRTAGTPKEGTCRGEKRKKK